MFRRGLDPTLCLIIFLLLIIVLCNCNRDQCEGII